MNELPNETPKETANEQSEAEKFREVAEHLEQADRMLRELGVLMMAANLGDMARYFYYRAAKAEGSDTGEGRDIV